VSFGKGRHSCIGGSLVLKEVQAALHALFSMSSLELAETPTWAARPGHRWLNQLPIRIRPG
jgi:cytochrome P450